MTEVESVVGKERTSSPSGLMHVLAFLSVYLIWGSTYLAIHVAVQTLPPFLMAGMRFMVAGLCLLAVARIRGLPRASSGQWFRAGLSGVLMLTVGNGLVSWSETKLPSNIAALLLSTVPLHMALIDWFRPGGRRPRLQVLIGIAVGSLGVLLLMSRDSASAPRTSAASWAMLAVLIAGFSWSLGTLMARHGRLHAAPMVTSGQQMVCGGAVLLLISTVKNETRDLSAAHISAASWTGLLYLIIFGSMVAFSAYAWLTVQSTTARLSTIAYVNPLIAVILGWIVLGESLGARALWGAGLIVFAVVTMTVRFRWPGAPRIKELTG